MISVARNLPSAIAWFSGGTALVNRGGRSTSQSLYRVVWIARDDRRVQKWAGLVTFIDP